MKIKLNLESISSLDMKLINKGIAVYDAQFIAVKVDAEKALCNDSMKQGKRDINRCMKEIIEGLRTMLIVSNLTMVKSGVKQNEWDIRILYNKKHSLDMQIIFNETYPAERKVEVCKKVCHYLRCYESDSIMASVHYRTLVCKKTKETMCTNDLWIGSIKELSYAI